MENGAEQTMECGPPDGPPGVAPGQFFAALCRSWADGLLSGEKRAVAAQSEGLWDRSQGWGFHLEPEFFLQLRGLCRFRFPRQRLDLTAGTLLMLPAGLPHRERVFPASDGGFRNAVIMRHGIHLAGPDPDRPQIPIGGCFRRAAPPGVEGFHAAFNRVSAWPEAARDQIFRTFCAGFLRLIAAECERPATPVDLSAHSAKVSTVIGMIRNRSLGAAPEVSALARIVGCTPNYLSGRFRRETGMRISEFINAERLEYARKMLETTQFQIAEIAWSCGFQDASYFTERFRARFGRLPSETRG